MKSFVGLKTKCYFCEDYNQSFECVLCTLCPLFSCQNLTIYCANSNGQMYGPLPCLRSATVKATPSNENVDVFIEKLQSL